MKTKSILRSLALTIAALAVSALLGACETKEDGHGHMHQHADGTMHHHDE